MLKYYDDVMGYITIKQDEKRFKLEIRKGNCLAVVIHKQSNTLMDFFSDEKHLRNRCKATDSKEEVAPILYDVINIKLNLFYKESRILLDWLVKYYNIECYWEINKK